MTNTQTLVCPECKGQLEKSRGTLFCLHCKKNYPVRDGIPDFAGSFDYWGEIDQESMKTALETASKEGYLSAITEIILEHKKLAYYLLSSTRIDWIFHCFDPKRSKACLDIGSGWGTLSFLLLNYFDEVWSLEGVWEKTKFQKIVKNQEKLTNLNLVRGLADKLPFPNNYFDLVVANGIMEWVALGDFSRDPQEVQLDFLGEIRRVLKNGGCLYLGIENRIGYNNFLGAKDHSGLPYTSLLPRKVASALVALTSVSYRRRLHGKKVTAYRTYTYSLLGYLKLLRRAGFSEIDFYWTNDYNYPKFSAKINDLDAFSFYLKNKRLWRIRDESWKKFRDKAYLFVPETLQRSFFSIGKMFFPCLLIFAYKGCKGETLESQVMKQFPKGKMSYLRVSGSDYYDSNVMYFVIDAAKNSLHRVVKLPRFKRRAKVLEEKERSLSTFNDFSYEKSFLNDMPFYVEKKIPASCMQILNRRHNFLALEWLLDFQQKMQKEFLSREDLDSEVSILTGYLESINAETELKNKVKEDLVFLFDQLKERRFRKTSEHGDYWAGNILVRGRNIFVADWEDYKDYGNPLFDFGFFLVANSQYTEFPSHVSFYRNFAGEGHYSNILKEIIRRFLEEKNLTAGAVCGIVPYVMMRVIRGHDPRFGRWKYNFTVFTDLLKLWYNKKKEIDAFLL